jgi:predicted Zn-ribbon and HTH transcriptional regulator
MMKNPIINYIQNRVINENKNFLCCIIGPTGSGKSWASLKLGETIDNTFNSERIVFSLYELAILVNKNFPPGTVFVLDEAGIAAGARTWQSELNKMINYMLQTFRSKNYILFFTVPHLSFIDKQTRLMLHSKFEMNGIDFKKEESKIKPFFLQVNPALDKIYAKYMRIRTKGRGLIAVKRLILGKPSKNLVEGYEKKKRVFLEGLLENIKQKSKLKLQPKIVRLRTFRELVCNQCSYIWKSNRLSPRSCPNCGTNLWNKPKKEPVSLEIQTQ